MRRRWSALTVNQKLGIGAFVLGVLALGANPYPGHAVSIEPRDLAVMVQREVDHVSAREVADWIVAGRADFRLLDLRTAEAYSAYHLPGAEHVPLAALPDRRFDPLERVVLYSDGTTHAAQAWFLMRARGARNAYILQGGLDAWKDEVLFPRLGEAATPFQQHRNEGLARVAAHFGGRAIAADGPVTAADHPDMPLPSVVPTAPAAGSVPAAGARKKKEGC